MIGTVEIIFESKSINLTFKDGKLEDIAVFTEDNDIAFSGTANEADFVRRALEFAFAYNVELQESGLTTGLETDRQEIE